MLSFQIPKRIKKRHFFKEFPFLCLSVQSVYKLLKGLISPMSFDPIFTEFAHVFRNTLTSSKPSAYFTGPSSVSAKEVKIFSGLLWLKCHIKCAQSVFVSLILPRHLRRVRALSPILPCRSHASSALWYFWVAFHCGPLLSETTLNSPVLCIRIVLVEGCVP